MIDSLENNGDKKDIQDKMDELKRIYSEHKSLVFNLCCRYFPDKSEAEDVCHDIFVKIYNNIDSFREESKITTWIYRLAVNYCLNCIRKKKTLKWFSLNLYTKENECEYEIPDSKNIEEEFEKEESAALLNKALEKLPERQKTALLLNKYDELSYQDIAQVMRCSVSSVESLIFRAKQTLAKQLLKQRKI